MSLRTAIYSTTSLVFLASSAAADVTANDIWADWKSYLSGFGYSVDAQESMSGDTLTVTDLNMTVPMPEGTGSFAITLSSIDFVENGDGTVDVVFPEVMPMVFAGKGPEDELVKGSIEHTTKNMKMRASGVPDQVTYTYTADQLGMALTELTVDGDALPMDALKAEFVSNNVSGTSVMEPGALRKIVQEMTLGESTYQVNFQAPDSSDGVVVNGKIASMAFSGETLIPEAIDPQNMADAMNKGFAVNGGFSYTGSTAEFAVTDGGDTMGGSSSAASAQINVAMNKDALEYTGGSKDTTLNIMGGEIPLPIAVNFGEVAFKLLMPVAKAEEPSDFAFGLTLGDFETSEDLWSMLDPGKVLPRDPATIAIDLTGKAKMLFDFFDPEQMQAVENGETVPAELNAVTLNKLLLSIAGAQLSGTGDFTFDNSDLETFDGMPKPTGGIDLSLLGGNGLMDKLVQMGLLPQEQAMGARMMMGLFARPGEGEDSLTSKIEINAEGHILANGQRIQ
ncbi:MAG: DUF2125 domain-containing protein [Planktotalea sp.]|uniref:DUF2125 domain-containing protein n=1 Tax=Planktotalea sp. TaxID=2029877 RepID=UPI003C75D6CF